MNDPGSPKRYTQSLIASHTGLDCLTHWLAQMDIEELLEIARQIVDKQKFCFAISVTTDGEANARIVQPRKLTQDWSVDFATRRSCRKFNEIERSGKLTLAYQDDIDRAYVSPLAGHSQPNDISSLARRTPPTQGARNNRLRASPVLLRRAMVESGQGVCCCSTGRCCPDTLRLSVSMQLRLRERG